jgi:hypothetical protein
MSGIVGQQLGKLPVLKVERKPGTAAIIGLVFGSVGLGIYFRSFLDFLIPSVIGFMIGFVTAVAGVAVLGLLAGVVFSTCYGYYRAQESNERRAATDGALPQPVS